MTRKLSLFAALVIACSSAILAAPAEAAIPPQGKVGPNQSFTGLINGHTGIGTPVTIRMACFGAIRPGQTGHPMAGQTVEVLLPEVITTNDGFTGPSANRISTFFNAPPPSPAATPPTTGTVTFRRYAAPKAIPTSLLLPCAGQGNVYFVPFPSSPLGPAKDAVVPVSYVGQP